MICGQCGKTIWAAEGEPCICSCQKKPKMTREQMIDEAVRSVVNTKAIGIGDILRCGCLGCHVTRNTIQKLVRDEFRKIVAAQ